MSVLCQSYTEFPHQNVFLIFLCIGKLRIIYLDQLRLKQMVWPVGSDYLQVLHWCCGIYPNAICAIDFPLRENTS